MNLDELEKLILQHLKLRGSEAKALAAALKLVKAHRMVITYAWLMTGLALVEMLIIWLLLASTN